MKELQQWACDMCRAFGVDPTRVCRFTLSYSLGTMLVADFHLLAVDDNGLSVPDGNKFLTEHIRVKAKDIRDD